jgi:hypothetical protein
MATEDVGGTMDAGTGQVAQTPDLQALEPVLAEAEARVDALAKQAGKLSSAIKAWQKATKLGHLANRQKAIAAATKLLDEMPEVAAAAAGDIPVRAYLESGAWRRELAETLRTRYGIAAFGDPSGALVCPPVVVSADVVGGRLRVSRAPLSALRPTAVADEVKRHHDRVSAANCQEFVEGLYAAAKRLCAGQAQIYAPFHEIYALFADTPGWKKANPAVEFGQSIYALHQSSVRATKDGSVFQVRTQASGLRPNQIFTVYGRTGASYSYSGISFFRGER